MKECRVCGDVKPVTEFSKRARSKDGLQADCKACCTAYLKEYSKRNRDKINERNRKRYAKNAEKERQRSAQWRKDNPEKRKEVTANYRNQNREKCNKATQKWAKANPDKRNVYDAKRRAAKLNATPSWLTNKHWKEIKKIYGLRSICSLATQIDYHVDHIVPLRGTNVCGLHVPWNLQVITAEENFLKGNKF